MRDDASSPQEGDPSGLDTPAPTEHSSFAVPTVAHGLQTAGSKRPRTPENGLASEAPALAPETAAAHVPEQQPGNNKRKRSANQHVKVNSAPAHDTAISTISTASPGTAVGNSDVGVVVDPEDQDEVVDGEDEVKEALSRPPPVNSDHLPLPWKGRIGYV